MPEDCDIGEYLAESALFGITLELGIHRDRVIEELRAAGIDVLPSRQCFKIIRTNFKGNFRKLLALVPALSSYPVRQHRWWHRTTSY